MDSVKERTLRKELASDVDILEVKKLGLCRTQEGLNNVDHGTVFIIVMFSPVLG